MSTVDSNGDLAYFLAIPACDAVYEITRTAAILRRVEARFGAIDPLSRRLERADVTQAELLGLIVTLLDDVPDSHDPPRPTRDAVSDWLFIAGTHAVSRQLAGQVFTLIMGNDALTAELRMREHKRQLDGKAASSDAAGAAGVPAGPFVSAAAPIGRGG